MKCRARPFLMAVAFTASAAAPAQSQTSVSRARNASGVVSDAPVQGQIVRTMIVTCKFDETLRFYRDVLGQVVASDDGGKPVTTGQKIIDMPSDGRLRMVIFHGTGEYQGGPMIGSRIGVLALTDPQPPAC